MRIRPRERKVAKVFGVDSSTSDSDSPIASPLRMAKQKPKAKKISRRDEPSCGNKSSMVAVTRTRSTSYERTVSAQSSLGSCTSRSKLVLKEEERPTLGTKSQQTTCKQQNSSQNAGATCVTGAVASVDKQDEPAARTLFEANGRGKRVIRRAKILGVDDEVSLDDLEQQTVAAVTVPTLDEMHTQFVVANCRSDTAVVDGSPVRKNLRGRKTAFAAGKTTALTVEAPLAEDGSKPVHTAYDEKRPERPESPTKSSETLVPTEARPTPLLSSLLSRPLVLSQPALECYSLHYLKTVGVPFIFTNGTCGVWFKDKSCVLLESSSRTNKASQIVYINKHRHRFVVKASSDGLVALPRRLEKKIFGALWCRQFLRADKHTVVLADAETQQSSVSAEAKSKKAASRTHSIPLSLVTTVMPILPLDADVVGDIDTVEALEKHLQATSMKNESEVVWSSVVPADSVDEFPSFIARVDVLRTETTERSAIAVFYVANKSSHYPDSTYYASD